MIATLMEMALNLEEELRAEGCDDRVQIDLTLIHVGQQMTMVMRKTGTPNYAKQSIR